MPSFHVSHAVSRLAAALALLSAARAAQALDYSGYFRGGPGLTSKNTARACYHRRALFYKNGTDLALQGAVQTIGTDIESNAAWDVTLAADNTPALAGKAIQVLVTGDAATNIRWAAEVTFRELVSP